MLSADEIREALRGIDSIVAVWVLAHIEAGHPWEAQRLLSSQLPPDRREWVRELVASITRDRVLQNQ